MKPAVTGTAPVILTALFAVIMILRLQGDAEAQAIRLIVRGDDFGMTQGSLVAFQKAFNEGVLTCGSLLVQPPWFEGAAELCRKNPGWCIGVHLSLVGEWRGYRWRPVCPWDRVSSVVDEDGFLFAHPSELFKNNPKIDEIDAELRAQIDLAKKKGVKIHYIDTHYMSTTAYPGLSDVIKRISRDYNLPVSGLAGEKWVKSMYRVPVEQKKKRAIEMLGQLQPGLWLWVCHIGIDSPEQNALIHSAPEDIFRDGGVGPHRAAELDVVTSPEVKSVILKRNIQLTDYEELAKEK
jgi:predicted glycoside hydrolase/deacetylase ChbG (UPF0249 family)